MPTSVSSRAAPGRGSGRAALEAAVDTLLAPHTETVRAIARALRVHAPRGPSRTPIEQVDAPDGLIAFGRSMKIRALLFAIAPHAATSTCSSPTAPSCPIRKGLIEGTGKRIRHVKVRSVEAASGASGGHRGPAGGPPAGLNAGRSPTGADPPPRGSVVVAGRRLLDHAGELLEELPGHLGVALDERPEVPQRHHVAVEVRPGGDGRRPDAVGDQRDRPEMVPGPSRATSLPSTDTAASPSAMTKNPIPARRPGGRRPTRPGTSAR